MSARKIRPGFVRLVDLATGEESEGCLICDECRRDPRLATRALKTCLIKEQDNYCYECGQKLCAGTHCWSA